MTTTTIAAVAGAAHAAAGPDGKIYLARPGRGPAIVGTDPAALVAAIEAGGPAARVRVLGSARNAAAVAALAAAHAAGRLRLELATPTIAGRYERAHDDPRAVLEAAAAPGAGAVAASLGGWHEPGPHEAAAYAAAAAIEAGGSPAGLLEGHPVLARLRFLDPRCDDDLQRVVAGIRDPRWYVDPARPDRLDRLKAYFGLDRDQAARRPVDRGAARRRLAALGAWRVDVDLNAAARPGGWLLRAYATSPRSRRGAELAATRCLLRFVRDVWLDWLYPAAYPGGEYFSPEAFFARALGPQAPAARVARAYRDHVAAAG